MLFPAAKPTFAARVTFTPGKRASIASGVPSVEPLSTRSHSTVTSPSEACTESSVSSARSRPWCVTTTIETSGVLDMG